MQTIYTDTLPHKWTFLPSKTTHHPNDATCPAPAKCATRLVLHSVLLIHPHIRVFNVYRLPTLTEISEQPRHVADSLLARIPLLCGFRRIKRQLQITTTNQRLAHPEITVVQIQTLQIHMLLVHRITHHMMLPHVHLATRKPTHLHILIIILAASIQRIHTSHCIFYQDYKYTVFTHQWRLQKKHFTMY